MNEYRDYTIEISLKSPIVTSFQSDTIFGHICWAISFLKWEGEDDKLRDFLESYPQNKDNDQNKTPPLLLSNGFPKGYLPKPVIPPITQQQLESIIGRENRIDNAFKVKAIKSMDIIPKQDLLCLNEDGKITPLKLFGVMFKRYGVIANEKSRIQPMVVQHNTVNRMMDRVTSGLYSQEEFFCNFNDEESGKFEIYLKTWYFSLEELSIIFNFIQEGGYGRDKSTGKGCFTFEIKEGIDLPEPKDPNAFMTLSSYIPTEKDPTEGYYNVLLKYGKLGGSYAKGAEVRGNPFKTPLLMFSAGSTFYDNDYRSGKSYGSLLAGVHHKEEIRHYAYAFPLGINLEPPKDK